MRLSTATALAVTAAALAAAPAADAADGPRFVDVQFTKAAGAQLRDGRLQTGRGGFDLRVPGATIGRLFSSADESDLTAEQNRFFRVRVPTGGDPDAIARALRRRADVALAEVEPEAAPLPTADFSSLQGYRLASASGGIGADAVKALAGGTGSGVGIIDIEYSWNRSHEDLAQARAAGALIPNGTPCDPYGNTDHGTAVLGELAGDANGFGVTGLATGARVRTVNAARLNGGACTYDLANAINTAAASSSAGDVILLEQQVLAPGAGADDHVPVEYYSAYRTAIAAATARGVIVVEAAGNGAQNLDSAAYAPQFATDSGAIIVGAGNAPGCTQFGSVAARGRLWYSTYGTRVDVQGWGGCVATTGYGDLLGASLGNTAYTRGFTGTSSASPIVASSAALLSAVAKARGMTLTPAAVRSLLKRTGQAQSATVAGHVGPLPDVQAAVNALGPKVTVGARTISGTALGTTTVPVRQAWSASGATAYDVFLSTDGGAWVRQSTTASAAVFNLERNHDYRFAARARNAAGMWGEWAYGSTFNLGEYQENYTTTNPLYTGTWTRAAYAPASSGFLKLSSTPGARVSFSFTGREVAWIGTKATNRGAARVYVDGVLAKTVDMYSATTVARAIAFRQAWATSGAHKITIEVVGTAGRPKVDVDAFVRLR